MQLEAGWTFPSRWSNGDCVHPLRLTGRGGTRAGPPVHCGSSIEAAALRPGGPRRDAARPDTALRPEKTATLANYPAEKVFWRAAGPAEVSRRPPRCAKRRPGGGHGRGNRAGRPPLGASGALPDYFFDRVFGHTGLFFFCRGTPCGLPRCVGTAVRARKSGMEVRTVSRGNVALAALEERWTSEEAPARPSAALPARLHPLATTRQLCRPTPPPPQ